MANPMDPTDELEAYALTEEGADPIDESCRWSGLGRTTLYKLIREKRVKTTRIPGCRRTLVLRQSLRHVLAEGLEK